MLFKGWNKYRKNQLKELSNCIELATDGKQKSLFCTAYILVIFGFFKKCTNILMDKKTNYSQLH